MAMTARTTSNSMSVKARGDRCADRAPTRPPASSAGPAVSLPSGSVLSIEERRTAGPAELAQGVLPVEFTGIDEASWEDRACGLGHWALWQPPDCRPPE